MRTLIWKLVITQLNGVQCSVICTLRWGRIDSNLAIIGYDLAAGIPHQNRCCKFMKIGVEMLISSIWKKFPRYSKSLVLHFRLRANLKERWRLDGLNRSYKRLALQIVLWCTWIRKWKNERCQCSCQLISPSVFWFFSYGGNSVFIIVVTINRI